MSGIFLRQGDELVPMVEVPYEAETVLQELLELYPTLLAGDDAAVVGGEWLLIRREAGVTLGDEDGPRGVLDHLFVDGSGVPTSPASYGIAGYSTERYPKDANVSITRGG
jgi:hypothetical protein